MYFKFIQQYFLGTCSVLETMQSTGDTEMSKIPSCPQGARRDEDNDRV